MGTYYSEGIILGHQDYREADRLLTIYSKEFGVIKAVARGSRKITSKLAGSLEPFIMATFLIARGRHYDTIAHAEVVVNFKILKNDFSKIQLASNLGETIGQITRGHQKDLKIFNTIAEVFTWLDNPGADKKKFIAVRWYLLWRLIADTGYHPELFICQVCKKHINEANNFFSNSKGGLVHDSCRREFADAVTISVNAIKFIRHLLGRPLAEVVRVQLDQALIKEIQTLTDNFLEFTLEQQLKSAHFPIPG